MSAEVVRFDTGGRHRHRIPVPPLQQAKGDRIANEAPNRESSTPRHTGRDTVSGRPNWNWRLLDALVEALPELDRVEDLRVLLIYIKHANADGFAWPSRATVAEMCGMQPRNVTRATRHLRDLGYLRLAEPSSATRRRSNCFHVLPGRSGATGVSPDTRAQVSAIGVGPDTPTPRTPTRTRESVSSAVTELPLGGPPPKQRTRRSDPLFEALADATGLDWHTLTATERGRLNKAAKELRDIGVEAEQIAPAAAEYQRQMPEMPLTPNGIAANWHRLNGARPQTETARFMAQWRREHPDVR